MEYKAKVIHGDGIGKQLGFPTANLDIKKVDWPSKQKVGQYTLAVIQLSIAVAIFLGLLDLLFSGLIEKYLF